MDCRIKALENKEIESIADSYHNVTIHTESNSTIKAHKLILATKSSWFHNYFKKSSKQSDCSIVFFNVSDNVVKTCINLIYGKEVVVHEKEKNRIVWFLSKLGVKWEACTVPSDNPGILPEDSNVLPDEDKGENGILIIS